MQKTELLDHTAALPAANCAAIKLARNSLPETGLELRRAKAAKIAKTIDLGSGMLGAALGAVGFYLTANMVYSGEDAQHHSALANAIAMVTMGGLCAWAVWASCRILGESLAHFTGISSSVELLTPSAGTQHCEDGVNALVSGGPLPTLWRDIALQERSQLYVFDIRILQTLANAERVAAVKRAREAELAEACRVLHGVPTSAN